MTDKARVFKRDGRWLWRFLPDCSTNWHQADWGKTFDIAFRAVTNSRIKDRDSS